MSTPSETTDPKQLRSFGLIMAGMMVLFFALLIPWIWDLAIPVWPWIVSAIFALVAFVAPELLKPVYTAWMRIGAVLGWINTRLILGIVFFLIFFPVGMVMRLINDPMRRTLHEPVDTYRIQSKQPVVDHLERPF